MSVDDLAPCVARSSTAMVLNMQDKLDQVFHKEGFQLHVPSQCSEIIGSVLSFSCFLK